MTRSPDELMDLATRAPVSAAQLMAVWGQAMAACERDPALSPREATKANIVERVAAGLESAVVGMAILFRLDALLEYLAGDDAAPPPGALFPWLLRKDGKTIVSAKLFQAAASAPLRLVEGKPTFADGLIGEER